MRHHIPVLLDDVVKFLDIKPEGIYMDCTIGFGGHSKSIIKKLNKRGLLIGLDLDPYALNETEKKLNQYNKNVSLHNCSYSVFPQILEKLGIDKIDGFLFDLGISSYQIDSEQRGFSYMKNSKLDMRFNNNDQNIKTAKNIVNSLSEKSLSEAFKDYGDLHDNDKIAKAIINARAKKEISTTFELKEILTKALPYINYKKLSVIFQVIRILVNDEINTFKNTLKQTINYLKIGGKIAVISFHSIEDRIVKHFFKDGVIYKNTAYDIEYKDLNHKIKVLTKKPIVETFASIKNNRRSRSAKLRVAERIS